MINVLICGAGSIGNHLCFACRSKGWEVDIFDIDPAALERTRKNIYPARYGEWDKSVRLIEKLDYDKTYDLIIVGTPPDSHLKLMTELMSNFDPRVLLVEKPLCGLDMGEYQDLCRIATNMRCTILVGYNHNLTRNTVRVEELISEGIVGKPLSLHVRWLEHWGGIFAAHPWLTGPEDSYLGQSQLGGGACGEHSHAISLWQHFARCLGAGDVEEVLAHLDMIRGPGVHYDQTANLVLVTSSGLAGSVTQDVVSAPPTKMARIQGDKGFIEWYAAAEGGDDLVIFKAENAAPIREQFPRSRPDDFVGEIDHVEKLLSGEELLSPISLEYGAKTMTVVSAAHQSSSLRKSICIS